MIKNSEFITSAVNSGGWIPDEVPEVCFIGRSNVGKSSFINALCNRNKLAKISSTPGKTRLLNFFSINNNQYRIVDAPGYGFARVSDDQKILFGAMMEEYLCTRDNLKFVAHLLDLRHKPTRDDIEMYDFFKQQNIRVLIVGTKIDKLKRNDIQKNIKLIKETIDFDKNDEFVCCSSTTKENLNNIFLAIDRMFGFKID